MYVRLVFLWIISASSWLLGAGQVLRPTEPATMPLANNATAADPFDIETGIYFRNYQDLFVEDSIPINFVRTQRNMDPRVRSFGVGSSTSYDMFIIGDVQKFSWVALVLADGGREEYTRISPGTGYADGIFENKTTPDRFFGSRISWNWRGNWTVKLRDGNEFTIQGCSAASKPGQCAVIEERNSKGERLVIKRDREGNIQRIISPHGRFVTVATDSAGRITRVEDDTGRWVNYRYDSKSCLSEAWNSQAQKQEFQYDDRLNLISIHETGAATAVSKYYNFSVTNQYDEHDRLKFQTTSMGQKWSVEYITREDGHVRVANVTGPDGLTRYFFTYGGYEFREEYLPGTRSGYTLDLARDAQSNFVRAMTLTCKPEKIHLDLPLETDIRAGESRRELLSALCDHATHGHTFLSKPNLPKQRWTELN